VCVATSDWSAVKTGVIGQAQLSLMKFSKPLKPLHVIPLVGSGEMLPTYSGEWHHVKPIRPWARMNVPLVHDVFPRIP
jgi:hypothetical protein